MRTALLLTACCLAALGAADDLLAGVVWTDGKARSRADYPDDSLVVMYFCGHCPRAGAYMNTTAKEIDAAIEKARKPVRLFCITPDLQGADLEGWAKAHGYVGAVVGYDPLNREKVSLNNIFQGHIARADGKASRLRFAAEDTALVKELCDDPAAGRPRYAATITLPQVSDLWWACERERPQAVRNLLAAQAQVARKKDETLKTEVGAVVDAVKAAYERELGVQSAAAPSLAVYEALEAMVSRYDGLDLKGVVAKLKELGKDKAMKDELAARDVWRQCQKLKASQKRSDQQAYSENMAALAKRWPNTVYGARAAQP